MTIVKSQIRRGPINSMPVLDAGELGLATDENRVFIGTEPNSATWVNSDADNNNVSLQFWEGTTPIELDSDSHHALTIEVWNISGQEDILVNTVTLRQLIQADPSTDPRNDTRVIIPHGLVDDNNDPISPTTSDYDFRLRRNKEITTIDEERRGQVVYTTEFTKTPGNTNPEFTGIDFVSTVKNFVKIEYVVYTDNIMRQGTIDLMVDGIDSSISDTYTLSNVDPLDDGDLKFSIEFDAPTTFRLMFNTSSLLTHTFQYKQTSFKRLT